MTIQRVNMLFGPVGQIDVDLSTITGKSTVLHSTMSPMDHYDQISYVCVLVKTQQVPVYERNKNCNITLKSFPLPATRSIR